MCVLCVCGNCLTVKYRTAVKVEKCVEMHEECMKVCESILKIVKNILERMFF